MGLSTKETVVMLCKLFLANAAYYRGGWKDKGAIYKNSNFYRGVNGNFLDIATLEWCKLFADARSVYCWENFIEKSSRQNFLIGLLVFIKSTEKDFSDYKLGVRAYRDKAVAHLDKDLTGVNYFDLDIAIKSVQYYYEFVTNKKDFIDHYNLFFDEAKAEYIKD